MNLKQKNLLAVFLLYFPTLLFGFAPEKEFQPYMIDHPNLGCPANSHCSAEFGKKRKIWSDMILRIKNQLEKSPIEALEKVRQNSGFPIPVWATNKSLENPEVVSWHSPCRHHNLPNKEIYHAEVLLSDFTNWKTLDSESLTRAKIWRLKGEEVVEYGSLQGAIPTMLKNEQLYFTREEQGVYFGLLISASGAMKIVPTENAAMAPREVQCPAKLIEAYKAWNWSTELYQQTVCRAIWDQDQRTFHTFLFGWTC